MAMAEASASSSSYKSKTQKGSTVSNDVVSAHQQLRDNEEVKKTKRERITDEEKEEGRQTRSLNDETCAKIHEIFGNDEVAVVVRHKKKHKKHRSLESIYKATMPVMIVEDDKTRIIN